MTENIKKLLPLIQDHDLFKNNDFRLIGGTALSYNLNHRGSEDLDFCFKGELPVEEIDEFITDCEDLFGEDKVIAIEFEKGKVVDHNSFEATGDDIYKYEQNWIINDVKVTFFDGLPQTGLWDILQKDLFTLEGHIKITSVDSIFKTKSLTFYCRAKARDYFDIMYMLSLDENYTIEMLFDVIQTYEKAYYGEQGSKLFLDKLEHQPYYEKLDEKLFGLVDQPKDYKTLKKELMFLLVEHIDKKYNDR